MAVVTFPETQNPAWGFFGTFHQVGQPAEDAWQEAMRQLTALNCTPEAVRAFLDSRHGRHFADDVLGGINRDQFLDVAIAATIAKWQAWRINRYVSNATGIPVGPNYLMGFIVHAAIEAGEDA